MHAEDLMVKNVPFLLRLDAVSCKARKRSPDAFMVPGLGRGGSLLLLLTSMLVSVGTAYSFSHSDQLLLAMASGPVN